MPIKIPDGLPAETVLHNEGIPTICDSVAQHQDIRPLSIGLLNLMPKKIDTETQIIRLLGQSPLQINLSLLRIERETRHTSPQHMETFYQSWRDVAQDQFDGLIITGAPIELMPFEEVSYWQELQSILTWAMSHTTRLMCICWGAQAALYHYYGIDKFKLNQKAFGVFRHHVLAPHSYLLRGINDRFFAPVSRYTGTHRAELLSEKNLHLLVECPHTGPAIAQSSDHRQTFIFNHVEYDSTTLAEEYERDLKRQEAIGLPINYYPDDDTQRQPINRWRSTAHLLFRNWVDDIYLATPYDTQQIGRVFLDRHLQQEILDHKCQSDLQQDS